MTKDDAEKVEWDIIVVGAGFGGGVLGADLHDTNEKLPEGARKNILLIERGGLIFHSHCLNGSRPTKTGDSGQQNDAFFQDFKSPYATRDSPDWVGGAVYAFGGRSNVWGLFIPRPHHETLDRYFPQAVVNDLRKPYFRKAETLLRISYPETRPVHQALIDALNATNTPTKWQWGRMASDFKEERNFDFAEGGYSTVDKLLEIAMNNSKSVISKFNILADAEVTQLNFEQKTVKSLQLRGYAKPLRAKHVVLSAGSVHSAAILRRSQVPLEEGLQTAGHLTDHDMFLVERSFHYQNGGPVNRQDVGPMKVQTFVKLGSPGQEVISLANISVDSSSFLPRALPDDSDLPKFLMVFILPCELLQSNMVDLVPVLNEPVITVKREVDTDRARKVADMNALIAEVMEAMRETFDVTFVNDDVPLVVGEPLKLGNVAHELGSLPMPLRTPNATQLAVVDNDLSLRGYNGVSVCDLSVFPVSTAANPSLTLAALALRLSTKLLPPPAPVTPTVAVANQTSAPIEVSVTKDGGAGDERVSVAPGQTLSLVRENHEGVFVYKDTGSDKYEFLVGHVGEQVQIV
jgi:choline dehydrogenase-like flavoprotein